MELKTLTRWLHDGTCTPPADGAADAGCRLMSAFRSGPRYKLNINDLDEPWTLTRTCGQATLKPTFNFVKQHALRVTKSILDHFQNGGLYFQVPCPAPGAVPVGGSVGRWGKGQGTQRGCSGPKATRGGIGVIPVPCRAAARPLCYRSPPPWVAGAPTHVNGNAHVSAFCAAAYDTRPPPCPGRPPPSPCWTSSSS